MFDSAHVCSARIPGKLSATAGTFDVLGGAAGAAHDGGPVNQYL